MPCASQRMQPALLLAGRIVIVVDDGDQYWLARAARDGAARPKWYAGGARGASRLTRHAASMRSRGRRRIAGDSSFQAVGQAYRDRASARRPSGCDCFTLPGTGSHMTDGSDRSARPAVSLAAVHSRPAMRRSPSVPIRSDASWEPPPGRFELEVGASRGSGCCDEWGRGYGGMCRSCAACVRAINRRGTPRRSSRPSS